MFYQISFLLLIFSPYLYPQKTNPMKKLLFLALASLSAAPSFSQIADGSRWGDYTAKVSGNYVTLTDSEDGTQFVLSKDGNRYFSQSESFDSEYKTFVIDGRKQGVLSCYGDNDYHYILLENVSHAELLNEQFRDMLEGTYTDSKGTKYTFTRDAVIINGKSSPYTLGNGWKEAGYIYFDSQEYMVKFSMDGLEFCELNNESDYFHYGPVLKKLSADNSKPRFAFTSKHLVARTEFEIRNSKELRLMRNEIYARHGYTFSSADLQKYFGAKPWYKPLGNNSAVKLSDIETFNVELLKNMEDMAKFEERAN